MKVPLVLSQGLFDLQVNGFGGVDFQKPGLTIAELRHSADCLRRHSTTRILLTLITDDIDALCTKLENVEDLRRQDAALEEIIAGYHLEGPYLNPAPGFRGAHPAGKMKKPELSEYHRLQDAAGGNIRLITLAPEWDGSDLFIHEVVAAGIKIAIGHSDATDAQIDTAIAAGATLCTHLGNGCPVQMHRHDNIVQRLLARDELTACFIPDGIHVPPATLRNFYRAKPPGKVVLTTDAMAAAAAVPGIYTLGPLTLSVGEDGIVREPGAPNFAGSSLTLDKGVMNFARYVGLNAKETWALASSRVCEALGMPDSILQL